ncbi:MAG TPA: hypothetical protein VLX92_31750 [Kofleriaceae bacterium]|nr:hypothetical protein [Kofleriaceae bacterium]
MPAPQAQMMQQFARLKFTSFGLKVPQNWQEPQGDAANQYGKALKPEEKVTAPGMPPLFQPASMVKHHTDAQKMHVAKIGQFIDDTCSAICSAWSQWQSMATMIGFVVAGPTVSLGQIVGPPLMPLIMAQGPKSTPMQLKFTNVIATVIGNAWLAFTATVKSPGLPFYPAYAAVPTPVAPPMPNVPVPFAALTQVPVSISTDMMKMQMVGMLADPQAPFHKELFESISNAFEQCYNLWKISTMVNNVFAIAAGGTPITPIPAVGTAVMSPGGFT